MNRQLWLRLDSSARRMTPVALTFVLVLVGAVPLHIPGLSPVVPLFSLMAVYHWAVFRPDLMPASAVLVIGILADALSGAPVGVYAIVFLAVYGAVVSQRRFLAGKTFAIVWLGFALIAAGASTLAWLFVSMLEASLVAPRAALFQYMLTLGTFPLVAWLLLRWQLAVLPAEE